MTDVSNNDGPNRPAKPRGAGRLLTAAIVALAAIGVVAVLIVMVPASFKPGKAADIKSLARGDMAKLVVTASAPPTPDLAFTGPDGHKVRLADFKGQVLVLNFWATWCAPCVTEMPALAKLQAAFPVQGLTVVAVSVDRPEDQADARAAVGRLPPLGYYSDPDFALPYRMQPRIEGLPTTILFDRSGKERARLSGGADWSGKDAKAVMAALLAEK